MLPVLAVSDTVVNSIGMGLMVLILAPLAAAVFVLLRRILDAGSHIAGAVLILTGLIACAEILMRAYFPDLYAALGVFTPLIAANVMIVAALTSSDDREAQPLTRAFKVSVSIAVILFLLGAARELVGRGSLLHDAGLMFGPWARVFETKVFRVDMGFLLGMLPPGAFIALGLMLAIRNSIAREQVDG